MLATKTLRIVLGVATALIGIKLSVDWIFSPPERINRMETPVLATRDSAILSVKSLGH